MVISLLTLIPARACYIEPDSPSDVLLYRLHEMDDIYGSSPTLGPEIYLAQSFDYQQENISLWLKQLANKLTESQLMGFIYGNEPLADVQFSTDDRVRESFKIMSLARSIQAVRKRMADPWYFPSGTGDGDECYVTLESLLEECFTEHSSIFHGRYVLQALRCMNAMHEYSRMIDYWEQERTALPKDVLYSMSEREAAAAYHRLGRDKEACRIYASLGDIRSLRYCTSLPEMSELEMVYESCADSPYFREEIQYLLSRINTCGSDDEWARSMSHRLLSLSQKAIRENRASNMAMWYYAASATLDALGKPLQAIPYIKEGMKRCRRGEFLHSSFHVLRMYIDAKTHPLDKEYEGKLLTDLRWLSRQVDCHMSDSLKESLCLYVGWTDNRFFWDDAMRRILLDTLYPRLMESQQTMRALQVANYANYSLYLNHGIDTRDYHSDYGYVERYDYCNEFFQIVDKLSAGTLAQYVQCLRKDNSPLGKYLNQSSKRNGDFWNDVVATHYIREREYAQAVQWFRGQSTGYEQQTNVRRYLTRDPFDLTFAVPGAGQKHLKMASGFKLHFAQKMDSLATVMIYGLDESSRARAKLFYGVGLRNQVERCWAYSRYMDGMSLLGLEDESSKEEQVEEANSLIEKALREMTNPEMRAHYLHVMARNGEVMKLFPKSHHAQYLRLHCDTWRDYACR